MNPATVDLETFIRSEFGSHGRRIIGGPAVAIDVRTTAVLAPVLNEIVSVAAGSRQSGADGGSLAVAWSCDHQGRCIIELIDPAGSNAVRLSQSAGRRSSRQQAGIEMAGTGMIRCETSEHGARIVIPARYIASRRTADQANGTSGNSGDPLRGRSVLVVEDQLLIALDLETLLLEQGAAAVQLCGSVEDALRSIGLDRPDIAILDVNLGDTTSFPVAAELQRLGVPLIFATGYGNEVDFPPGLRSVPLVAKPYCMQTIRDALLATPLVHA